MEKVLKYQTPHTKTGQGNEIPTGSKFSGVIEGNTTTSSKEGLDP